MNSNRMYIGFGIVSLVASLFCTATANAAERDEQHMRIIAMQKLMEQSSSNSPARVKSSGNLSQKEVSMTTASLNKVFEGESFALYTAEGVGSVFVSNDDACHPVLGYTSTILDMDNMPCCLRWWMSEMDRQYAAGSNAAVKEQNPDAPLIMKAKASAEGAGYAPVAPLVTTKWGQDEPFNRFAPVIGRKHAPSGCVATALAQIFNFVQYPTSASFYGSYYVGGTDAYIQQVNSTYTYPYQDYYGTYYTADSLDKKQTAEYDDASGDAIATLLRDCGYATNMDYATGGSGTLATEVFFAVYQKFGYPLDAVKIAERMLYSDDEWHALVYDELHRGYPILYTGTTKTDGHAFVVHGMDADGLVAVNWGWNGSGDGYFCMDMMNSELGSFEFNQTICYGFHVPALPGEHYASQILVRDFTLTGGTLFPLRISCSIYNYGMLAFNGKVSLILEDVEDGTTTALSLYETTSALATYYGQTFDKFNIDKTEVAAVPKGRTYKAYLASYSTLDAEWQKVRTYGGIPYFIVERNEAGKFSVGEQLIMDTAPSSIDAIVSEKPADTHRYTISGQPLRGDAHGIVIENGRKVFKPF